ncbi:MAG TPA: phospholipase D-like domain-containing protein [Levilinea sp.]|nr:phospholipase D-like domain-containing protein [Levilinea sp.]
MDHTVKQSPDATSGSPLAHISPVALFSILLLILLSGCAAFLTRPAPTLITTDDSPIQVQFTDPYSTNSGNQAGGIDEAIVSAMDAAERSIDVAIYNFSLKNVADALLRAHDRGVQVRVVIESDAIDGFVPQYLMENEIPVFGDRRESLMHNKFIVIDGLEVWVSSFNLTASGVYKDHNHIVRVRSAEVAENYTVEFEEMFIDDRFGAGSPANTPYPEVMVEGRRVEVLFSPDDGVARRLAALVESAEESVYFLAFSFTADDIGDAVLRRAAAGVEVRGVFDDNQAQTNTGTNWDRFRAAGLEVRTGEPTWQMHHKVIIIDRKIVTFGSYNYSNNAERRNDENVMITHDAGLAEQFIAEFERIYHEGKGG